MARSVVISGTVDCGCGQPGCTSKEVTGTLFDAGNIVQKFQYPAQMAGIAIVGWIDAGVIYEQRGMSEQVSQEND